MITHCSGIFHFTLCPILAARTLSPQLSVGCTSSFHSGSSVGNLALGRTGYQMERSWETDDEYKNTSDTWKMNKPCYPWSYTFNTQCLDDQLNVVVPGIPYITQYFCTNLYGTWVSLFFWIQFLSLQYSILLINLSVMSSWIWTWLYVVKHWVLGTPLVFVRRLSVSGLDAECILNPNL